MNIHWSRDKIKQRFTKPTMPLFETSQKEVWWRFLGVGFGNWVYFVSSKGDSYWTEQTAYFISLLGFTLWPNSQSQQIVNTHVKMEDGHIRHQYFSVRTSVRPREMAVSRSDKNFPSEKELLKVNWQAETFHNTTNWLNNQLHYKTIKNKKSAAVVSRTETEFIRGQ